MSDSSAFPQFHVVGFTGHRQVSDAARIGAAIETALHELRSTTPGEWIALSSIAAGGDSLFAKTAITAGLSWHAVLPLPPAEFKKDFSEQDWKVVESLLAEAEVVHVSAEAEARDDAYLDCGMETVNGCDVLLAVWDGAPARGKGGTAEVIAYARELGRPLVIIDATTGEISRENLEKFAGLDADLRHFNHLPAPATTWTPPNPFAAPESVVALQGRVDHAATHGAPHFRRLIVLTVLLHVVATLVAAASLAFGWHALALPWAKLLCLLGALAVALVFRA